MFEFLFIELDFMKNKILLLIKNIMKVLKDLTVNAITLVSKDKNPAVPKAETGFSIFKIFNKKTIVSKAEKDKLDSIVSKLDKTLKKPKG